MSKGDLIRPHDPFSGHEAPTAVGDATEPVKLEEPPPPPPAPAKKPVRRRAPGRRRRKPVTDEEVEAARKAVKP